MESILKEKRRKKHLDKKYANGSWAILAASEKAKYKNNPPDSLQYMAKKYELKPNTKLSVNIRVRLYMALKGRFFHKCTREHAKLAMEYLGCTIPELRAHLEKQFKEGMNWGNWSREGWHIDHIKPLASFDLTDHEHLKVACHYTNLKPLWARDNLSKGKKIVIA